jgi:cell division protein FtsB
MSNERIKKISLFGTVKVVLYLVIGFLVVSLIGNLGRLKLVRNEIGEAESRSKLIEKENQELTDNISNVRSGEYQEQQVRDKLGLAKESEIVLVLPDPGVLRKYSPRFEREVSTRLGGYSNWRQWWDLFISTRS